MIKHIFNLPASGTGNKWSQMAACFLRTPDGLILSVMPALVLLGTSITFGLKAALLRTFLVFLVSVTLYLVIREVMSLRIARVVTVVFLVVNCNVLIAPYQGPFKLAGIGWKPLDDYIEIRAQIPTQPNSPKWDAIRNVDGAKSYLYFSMSKIQQTNDVVLYVNEHRFTDIASREGVEVSTGAGGYALPLEFSILDERPVLNVRFELIDAEGLTFFSSFYEDDGSTMRSQEVCNADGCVPSEKAFEGVRLVLEIRVADRKGRTLGVLY